jgi:hypothetical protein
MRSSNSEGYQLVNEEILYLPSLFYTFLYNQYNVERDYLLRVPLYSFI